MSSPKTIVFVIAETRAHALTWNSFKSNLLDPLRADLGLCVSVPSDYDFLNPFWQHAKYKKCCPDFSDFGEAFSEAQSLELADHPDATGGNWRKLIGVRDQWLGGIKDIRPQPGSAGILIYFRWLLWTFIKEEGLLNKYDRFVITRSDFIWECPHPPLNLLHRSHIWIPDGEGYGGLTDRHAVLSAENIEAYLNIIKPVILNPEGLYAEMSGHKGWNLEQFIKFSLNRSGFSKKISYFPYVMYSVRELTGSSRWATGTWHDELGYFVKYEKEFESAQRYSKIITTSMDWHSVFGKAVYSEPVIDINSYLIDYTKRVITYNGKCFVSTEISKVDDSNLVMLVDRRDQSGITLVSPIRFGNTRNSTVEAVEIVNAGGQYISIRSKIDNKFYTISSEGKLIKLSKLTPAGHFRLQKRYSTPLPP